MGHIWCGLCFILGQGFRGENIDGGNMLGN